VLNLI